MIFRRVRTTSYTVHVWSSCWGNMTDEYAYKACAYLDSIHRRSTWLRLRNGKLIALERRETDMIHMRWRLFFLWVQLLGLGHIPKQSVQFVPCFSEKVAQFVARLLALVVRTSLKASLQSLKSVLSSIKRTKWRRQIRFTSIRCMLKILVNQHFSRLTRSTRYAHASLP